MRFEFCVKRDAAERSTAVIVGVNEKSGWRLFIDGECRNQLT